MEKKLAFIDEYGNFGFDFSSVGTTKTFIITAIIIDESARDKVEGQIETVRKKYFQTGEMKSHGIGTNHRRRVQIINDLCKSEFHFYSLVVDKKKIRSDTPLYNYKKSYLKFLSKKLHTGLKGLYPNLSIFSDNHGRPEFMEEFRNYVFTNTNVDLFDNFDFQFQDSDSEVLIQLADIVSGTLSFIYEESKKGNETPNYLQLLSRNKLRIDTWPTTYEETLIDENNNYYSEYDRTIKRISLHRANIFIAKNESSKNDLIKEQVAIAKHLRFYQSLYPTEYIPAYELISLLSEYKGKKIDALYLRSNVIAKLRDAGLLIASSSSKKGYKLPICVNDLYHFINLTFSIVMPMLRRLKLCRDILLDATGRKLDILAAPEYKGIAEYFDYRDK